MASACKIFTFYHDCMYKAIYATSRIIQLEKCFSNMRARNIIEKMSDRITREFPTQYFFSTYTLTENRKKKKKQEKKGRNKNENKKNSRNSFNYAYIVLYNCGNPIAAEGTLFLETLSFTYRFPRFNDNHFSNVSSLPDLKLTLSWLVTLSRLPCPSASVSSIRLLKCLHEENPDENYEGSRGHGGEFERGGREGGRYHTLPNSHYRRESASDKLLKA